jgi:MarR family transcriptional regulator for hemolysin
VALKSWDRNSIAYRVCRLAATLPATAADAFADLRNPSPRHNWKLAHYELPHYIVPAMPNTKLGSDKTLALVVWDVARLLRKAVDARAGEVGLTSAQWHLLSTLARCEKQNQAPPNQATLAELLDIEPITLSRHIDRLTAAGMLERHPHPGDRRAFQVQLTDKAWPVVLSFRTIASEVLARAFAGVTPAEIAAMIDALERVRTNLTGKAEPLPASAPAKSRAKESLTS